MTANSIRRARRLRVLYSRDIQQQTASVSNIVVNSAVVVVDILEQQLRRTKANRGTSTAPRQLRQRIRRSVGDIYVELGSTYFQRAYRMTYRSFKRLAAMLCPLINASWRSNNGTPRHCPNGPISADVRLACAIRWFTGGSTYGIMTTYGISHTDTINS